MKVAPFSAAEASGLRRTCLSDVFKKKQFALFDLSRSLLEYLMFQRFLFHVEYEMSVVCEPSKVL